MRGWRHRELQNEVLLGESGLGVSCPTAHPPKWARAECSGYEAYLLTSPLGPQSLFSHLQFLKPWVPSPLPGLVHRDSTCRPGCQASTLALLEMMLWPVPCLANLGSWDRFCHPSGLSLSVVVWERYKMLPVPLRNALLP